MKESQAIAVLMKVKANWYRQPADELTRAEWVECFMLVEYEDAIAAVIQLRRTREEPPTPGMLASAAQEIERRRFEERRYRQCKLVVVPTADERERCKAQLRELIETIGKQVAGAHLAETANEEDSGDSQRHRSARA